MFSKIIVLYFEIEKESSNTLCGSNCWNTERVTWIWA